MFLAELIKMWFTTVDTMNTGLRYTVFQTDASWISIVGSAEGLRCVTLPLHSSQEALEQSGDEIKHAVQSSELFNDLIERFRMYFGGNKTAFPDKLDLSGATPFQCKVWQASRLIPYGETRSYAWVANQIKNPKAARAVGQALGKNPLPIIVPCHRVITSDGKLGGFGGGLEMKRRLLSLEDSAGTKL